MSTDQGLSDRKRSRHPSYLDEVELGALHRPTSSARGLPSRTYTDPDLFALELETVFRRNWVGAALSHRVAGPGDVLPVEVGGLPLVLVRADDGVLRAFHNVSTYDACLVALAPASGTEVLRGPYHGFEWDHRGRLLRTPYFDGTPDPDPTRLPASGDLREVACGEWSGLVFVSVEEPRHSLEDHLAPVLERMNGLVLDELALCRAADGSVFVSTTIVPGNWKIAFENDVEVLHEAFVHAYYATSPFAPKVDQEGRPTYTAIADRGLYGLSAPVEHYYDEADLARLPLIPTAGGPHPTDVVIADLFPNVQVGVMADHYTVGLHLPVSVDSTLNEIVIFAPAEIASDAAVTEQLATLWDDTRAEDDVVVAATQVGRRSTAVASTFYADFWDGPVHEFHRQVASEVLRP
jgi:choline monooxygenase